MGVVAGMKLVSVYDSIHAAPFLYQLVQQRAKEPDTNISHVAVPTYAEHLAFIRSEPYRFWYLIEAGWPTPTTVGYISATRMNEIGIVLDIGWRGQGYGAEAVRMLMEKHQPLPAIPGKRSGKWLANINPKNAHSIALFTKLGFGLIQQTYAREV